jgi:translocation and assembly module TamB
LRKRTRVLVVAGVLIGGLIAAAAGFVLLATSSDWGRNFVRGRIVSAVAAQLVPGASFSIGALRRSGGSTWVVEKISLVDSNGVAVASIARVSLEISLPAILRGDIRLGKVIIDSAHVEMVRGRDDKWNTSRLLVKREVAASRGGGRRIIADSVEIRNSLLGLTMPDGANNGRPLRRAFSGIQLAAGSTIISDAHGSGEVPLRNLALSINDPPVELKSANGMARWWRDSVQVSLPHFRLPATHGTVAGVVGWSRESGLRLALDVVADTIAPADIRWMSKLIPSEGKANAKVEIRSAGAGKIRYAITEFDVRAFDSHVSGSFAVTPGRPLTDVRDLKLLMQPLDFALVRDVFGDTILKPAWRGAIEGRLAARGGLIDRFVIDTISALYRDSRLNGATSRLGAAGTMDFSGTTTKLKDFRVRLDSVDVRTLGAAMKAADSLRGAVKGTVTLNGPTSDIAFTDLRLRLVEAGDIKATVAGAGRISTNTKGHWLDAELALDSVAVASLVSDSIDVPLRGTIAGALTLGATADTMTIDARLRAGDGTAHLTGTTLLDSARTVMDLSGKIAGLDLRNYLDRKNIPAHSLSGDVRLTLDQDARTIERHVELHLDSTSTLGDSRLKFATVRFGHDSTGIHVDTAKIVAGGTGTDSSWSVEARGQLASKGTSAHDSLTFRFAFDSLGAIRTLILDTAGAPILKTLDGKLRADNGVIRGSFEHASLFADVNGTGLTVGTTTIDTIMGGVNLTELPKKTAGKFHGVVHGVTEGKLNIGYGEIEAEIFAGERARVAGKVETKSDSVLVSFGADVSWPDSVYTVKLDSLDAKFRDHTWKLAFPTSAVITKNSARIDSLVLRSTLANDSAEVMLAGAVPELGRVDATIDVRKLGLEELAYFGLIPADMTGRLTAGARLTGTRDAPVITANVLVQDVVTEDTKRPSISFAGRYEAKKANVRLAVVSEKDSVLTASGDIPIDLSLRTVEKRLIDAPVALKLHADSLSLALFEGLLPRITGLSGRLVADVDVGGTIGRPRGTGSLKLEQGTFVMQRFGLSAYDASAAIRLAGDSVLIERLRMSDGEGKRLDTASVTGVLQLAGDKWTDWTVALRSVANHFLVIDDPRIATAQADWNLTVNGELASPRVEGNVFLPRAVFTIGPQRRTRPPTERDSVTGVPYGMPNINGVLVTLGEDVRLKSKDANVQLEGVIELFGEANNPWVSGAVTTRRGTYQVNVGGLIRRSFRVDSGSVVIEGTTDMPISLDVYTSYLVRRPEEDVVIRAHVYGTADRPRLDLTSDLGTATSQSEIISYLVFGQPSFALEQGTSRQAAFKTASMLASPTIGGWLESTLGTIMPFFNTLQVTSTVNEDLPSAINSTSGLIEVLNSYAITGGRPIGSDSYLNVSVGRCSARSTSSGNSIWTGIAIDYRPKRTLGASLSLDPGPSPCSRLTGEYQLGLDLSYDWKFGGRARK